MFSQDRKMSLTQKVGMAPLVVKAAEVSVLHKVHLEHVIVQLKEKGNFHGRFLFIYVNLTIPYPFNSSVSNEGSKRQENFSHLYAPHVRYTQSLSISFERFIPQVGEMFGTSANIICTFLWIS